MGPAGRYYYSSSSYNHPIFRQLVNSGSCVLGSVPVEQTTIMLYTNTLVLQFLGAISCHFVSVCYWPVDYKALQYLCEGIKVQVELHHLGMSDKLWLHSTELGWPFLCSCLTGKISQSWSLVTRAELMSCRANPELTEVTDGGGWCVLLYVSLHGP